MYNEQPAHSHGLTPKQILPMDIMDLIIRHYAYSKTLNTENFNAKMSKKFTEEERAACAEAYEMLRGNGISPDSIGSDGDIRWMIQMKSQTEQVMKNFMPELPNNPSRKQIDEMKKNCRYNFQRIATSVEEAEQLANR